METTLCQCCLKKSCNEFTVDSYCDEKNINYSELLKETFVLNISSNLICDVCANRLTDAFEFRKQIVKSQDELRMLIGNNIDSQNDRNIETTETGEELWEIDKEEASTVSSIDNPLGVISTTDSKQAIGQRYIREDSLKLLKYSNMCLFKSLKTKFQCYSCKESFINMSDLRIHTITLHSNSKCKDLKGFSYKNADISSLACNLCQQNCNDLDVLKIHLINTHNVEFSSPGHMFIQYKLEKSLLCLICGDSFNTFVRLSSHMNTHSTNNVCEICGVFFINRLSLRAHLQSVHREKKCNLCSAKFDKNSAKVKHMRIIHNIGIVKRYCKLCGKDFKHSYKLTEHNIKEHGVKRQMSNCNDCSKTFLSPQNLKIHIRSVHDKERNFQCNICAMRFFTKADEKRHERKHQDVKLFSCSYCEGKFKSKDSWKRHLRRLHDAQNNR